MKRVNSMYVSALILSNSPFPIRLQYPTRRKRWLQAVIFADVLGSVRAAPFFHLLLWTETYLI